MPRIPRPPSDQINLLQNCEVLGSLVSFSILCCEHMKCRAALGSGAAYCDNNRHHMACLASMSSAQEIALEKAPEMHAPSYTEQTE